MPELGATMVVEANSETRPSLGPVLHAKGWDVVNTNGRKDEGVMGPEYSAGGEWGEVGGCKDGGEVLG